MTFSMILPRFSKCSVTAHESELSPLSWTAKCASTTFPKSSISHQLRILRGAGLVRPRKEGKESYYSLDDEHVEEIFGAGLAHVLHKGGMLDV